MPEIFLGNIKGEKGEPGAGFKVLDFFSSLDALAATVTNPSAGDAYGVGSAEPYDIYIYAPSAGWVNNGAIQGAKGEPGERGADGAPGEDGADGTSAIITGATATVDETTGEPSVVVTMGGTASERSFDFAFSGLKGEKGEQGPQGERGEPGEKGADGLPGASGIDGVSATITGVTATVDETTGTPGVTVTLGGTERERSFDFAFSGLKGEMGSTKIFKTSYTGTGGNGAKSLTFNEVPALVIISGNDMGTYSGLTGARNFAIITPYGGMMFKGVSELSNSGAMAGLRINSAVEGTTIKWQANDNTAENNLNVSGETYEVTVLYK